MCSSDKRVACPRSLSIALLCTVDVKLLPAVDMTITVFALLAEHERDVAVLRVA